jgi:RHS repeat-associated protein
MIVEAGLLNGHLFCASHGVGVWYGTCSGYTWSTTVNGNNQFPSTFSSFSYDLAGNTQNDGFNSYTWNAESQIKTAAGVTYNYDGDGRRVEKVGSKFYWYGSGGEILAETDTGGNVLNEYIYFGGRRLAVLPASGSPMYYAGDMLGSSRMIFSSATGQPCYDADFGPFGEERTYVSNCPNQNNYKFEGKERDTESQNDEFGARYYSWRYGRWLSSDWSSVPTPVPYANLTNPQTLNESLDLSPAPTTLSTSPALAFASGCAKTIISLVTFPKFNHYRLH